MQFTANQIADILKGSVDGDAQVTVSSLAKIEEAREGDLSFIANPKYQHFAYSTKASIVIVQKDLRLDKPVQSTLIRVDDPYSAFSALLEMYNQLSLQKTGREDPNFIHGEAKIGDDVYIGAFAYIGKGAQVGARCKIYPNVYIGDNVKMGNDVTLFPGVKLYADTVIGNDVIIHAGAVIGSDGFGFAMQNDGTYLKVSQIGNVVIEDRVEIGANTTIDRATLGSTIIREGVKLDNLIQIAHNAEIGQNTVVAAQSGISGSTKIGKNVVMGGQVGVVGHVTIADRSQFQAKSGINKSILEPGKRWSGNPLANYTSQLRSQVLYLRLPELEQRIAELEKALIEKEKLSH